MIRVDLELKVKADKEGKSWKGVNMVGELLEFAGILGDVGPHFLLCLSAHQILPRDEVKVTQNIVKREVKNQTKKPHQILLRNEVKISQNIKT